MLLATAVCGEQGGFNSNVTGPGGTGNDGTLPTGTFAPALNGAVVVAGDSVFVGIRAQDNIGVKSVSLKGFAHRGVDSLGTGVDVPRFNENITTFTTRTPGDTTLFRYLTAVLTDSTVEKVYIQATITDVANNVRTVRDSVNIVAGPFVRVDAPVAGSAHPVGVPLTITVTGRDPDNLQYLGYQVSGAVTGQDSIALVPAVTATRSLSLATTPTTPIGAVTVTPFAIDAGGTRFLGSPVSITLSDTARPAITIIDPTTPDVPVRLNEAAGIRVRVTDNRGVSRVTIAGVARRGIDSLGTGTNFPRFASKVVDLSSTTLGGASPADTSFTRYLDPLLSDTLTSERVYLIVTAQDSSGNTMSDTATILLVGGPQVALIRPDTGTQTSPGKTITVEVQAIDANGVSMLGYRVSGVYSFADSVIFSSPSGNFADTAVFTDTLVLPPATLTGSLLVTPFARDGAGDPSGRHPGVTVAVVTAALDATPPTVRFTVGDRIETDDSVTINATDAGGIRYFGFFATRLSNVADTLSSGVTPNDVTAHLTDATGSFSLALPAPPVLSFPEQVVVQAFAVDSQLNVGFSPAETLTVVAGQTYGLPSGSQIGDVVYNRARQELYLANTSLSRIEIFDLVTKQFVANVPLPVGSRPTSLALWPSDTLGNYLNRLIVANSGGTNLSIVDLVARSELRRHHLPTFDLQTVKTKTNQGGGLDIVITHYDLADRPFQLAALCVTGATASCDRVRVLYSTSPTTAQSFPLQGYVAWTEMDLAGTPNLGDHMLYEHSAGGTDTLQIFKAYASTSGQVSEDTILGAGMGYLATVGDVPFRQFTFVRGSGNAVRAVIGEGGEVDVGRVLTYDVRRGITNLAGAGGCSLLLTALSCVAEVDSGVSRSTFVRDFIVNRASKVTAVAINFNGLTATVRADSIYAFDNVIRLQGVMAVDGSNNTVGMDFHPCNNFDARTRTSTSPALPYCTGVGYDKDERMIFAARPDSSIGVFDTYFYGQVTDTMPFASTIPIPIRNALMGPIRIAAGTANTLMFGLTAYGLVVVDLPSLNNSLFPVRREQITSP